LYLGSNNLYFLEFELQNVYKNFYFGIIIDEKFKLMLDIEGNLLIIRNNEQSNYKCKNFQI